MPSLLIGLRKHMEDSKKQNHRRHVGARFEQIYELVFFFFLGFQIPCADAHALLIAQDAYETWTLKDGIYFACL